MLISRVTTPNFLAASSAESSPLMLSQTAEYALRASLWIAEHPDRAPVRVGDLAEALNIPQNYLSKTLHLLARAGVLQSMRGRQGGFRLARPAARTPLIEIVQPFERLGD